VPHSWRRQWRCSPALSGVCPRSDLRTGKRCVVCGCRCSGYSSSGSVERTARCLVRLEEERIIGRSLGHCSFRAPSSPPSVTIDVEMHIRNYTKAQKYGLLAMMGHEIATTLWPA